ncbi:hypothetical protein RHIZ_06345 [Rhizobium skierniewicense]|uniref:O-methyltransferase n=1 Tax=Rhizobium skierniewicense TaxID=984260 RepID=UPI001FAD4AFE|nr:O-methyltransferase [Rhizobium skierniewicense]MCI9865560.1 hypothetical protein [Rhizobium skierniewicense]
MSTENSFEAIDYRLRPAKYAERLMVSEIVARSRFHTLTEYQYVGMGSVYFTDFKLFHRTLGISRLTSIESADVQDRFTYNKPFNHITLSFGSTATVLPSIDWSHPALVWLDYDGQISQDKLLDAALVVSRAKSGSFLFFSINAEKPSPKGMTAVEREKDLVSALRRMVDPATIPAETKHRDLQGKQARRVYTKLINYMIEAELARYNAAAKRNGQPTRMWKQVMNLIYKDGATMLTIGGVIHEHEHEEQYVMSAFNLLSTYRGEDSEPLVITIPKLTPKEMTELESVVAQDPQGCAVLPFIPLDDRSNFVRFHRYLPNFVSADI